MKAMMWRRPLCNAMCLAAAMLGTSAVAVAGDEAPAARLRAGAAAVDVSPTEFPVLINGGFLERHASELVDPLYVRAVVLESGEVRIALAVVDSCGVPRVLLDQAKARASQRTGIPAEHMLISATHTHAAPAVWPALGCRADEAYAAILPGRIAEAIVQAAHHLEPARIGSAVVPARGHTANRRWIYRPGVRIEDPFGQRTAMANMHPGPQNPDAVGPSGPVDDDLALMAVQATDGRPIALLANYAMHYFGVGVAPVSADYFGLFAKYMEEELGHAEPGRPPFIAMMSQGTSGDLWWRDYSRPHYTRTVEEYSRTMAELALTGYRAIAFDDRPPLAMAETRLSLNRRTPDQQRLVWARQVAHEMAGRPPKTRPEVYALEQIYLHEDPTAELKLQAIRIGELAITALPNEVYAITGLKLKAANPLPLTMNIALANGAEGYIPPPEQHDLGGYNTWPARSAGLEVRAEPKILEAVIELIEEVSGLERRSFVEPHGPYAQTILEAAPLAYWRMGEFNGPIARDSAGPNHGAYEPLIAFHLPGPQAAAFCGEGHINRAPHFAGGRLSAQVEGLGDTYSIEMWFWSGVANDQYPVTGYLFSRGEPGAAEAPGDHLGIGGTHGQDMAGRLFFFNGNEREHLLAGRTVIQPRTWNHATVVREGQNVRLYLNGRMEAEGRVERTISPAVRQVFIGGRNDGFGAFSGKIDEVAVHPRALRAQEISARVDVLP